MRFSFKKLFDAGQTIQIDEKWSATFRAGFVPVVYDDTEDEPIPEVAIDVHLRRADGTSIKYRIINNTFIFHKKVPAKIREKLFRLQNDAAEIVDDDDKLDAIWQENLKKTWPPARKEWIKL